VVSFPSSLSLSMLLREIVERHYGFKPGKPVEEPFTVRLEKALNALGRAKMDRCPLKGDCPLRLLGVDPSPIVCGLCQIHGHTVGLLQASEFNPYVLG
jgi:hypothetical protein